VAGDALPVTTPSIATALTTETLIDEGVDPLVATVDLTNIRMLLSRYNRWGPKFADAVEIEYKRFMTLHRWNAAPDLPIVPTSTVDEMWHTHILDTQAYADDCIRIFGSFLHHFPYLGLRGLEDERAWREAVESTSALYRATFGEAYGALDAAVRRGTLGVET
jgi:hypothetical protein